MKIPLQFWEILSYYVFKYYLTYIFLLFLVVIIIYFRIYYLSLHLYCVLLSTFCGSVINYPEIQGFKTTPTYYFLTVL